MRNRIIAGLVVGLIGAFVLSGVVRADWDTEEEPVKVDETEANNPPQIAVEQQVDPEVAAAIAALPNKALAATVTVSTNTGEAFKIKDDDKGTVWTGTRSIAGPWGFFTTPETVTMTWSAPIILNQYDMVLPTGATPSKLQETLIRAWTRTGQEIVILPRQLVGFYDCLNTSNPYACTFVRHPGPYADIVRIEFQMFRRLDGNSVPQIGAQFAGIRIF